MTASLWRTTGEAEHAMLGLIGAAPHPALVMATHFVGGAVLVTAQWGDGLVEVLAADGPAGASTHTDLVAVHAKRESGRLFSFSGVDELVGRMTLAQLVARSAIDDVVMLGPREPLGPDAVIDTQGFVRPYFADGRVVLEVRPAAEGVVIPFEQRQPTPCCADH